MNFFERQHEVRKVSQRLVWLFVLAVVLIVVVVDLAVAFGFGVWRMPAGRAAGILAASTVLTVVIIGLTSWIRMLLLKKGGGGKVAQSLGGVYVPEDTADPQLRRLRNIVEEIAIASGMPVPELYVLPYEQGINAFAAGWAPGDAAVAVTRGALERLNRDELQGVIAHEFSHVVNGDMRLNIKLMGVLFGILGLAVVGRILLYGGGSGGSRNSKGGAAPLLLVGIAAFIAGYIGVFIGRLIKAAVSRQREYLADASAVQYTRQTEGLTGALKKIGGLDAGSKITAGKVEDVSHMLFGEGMKLSSMFATHPPLPQRIKKLDPAFDPTELEQLKQRWSSAPPSGLQEDAARGLTSAPSARPAPLAGARSGPAVALPPPPGVPQGRPVPPPPGPASPGPGRVAANPEAVVAGVGDPGDDAFRHAGNILANIPEVFLQRARGHETVVPLVFGLLISDHPEARARQHAALAQRHGPALAEAAVQDGGALTRLDPALLLPLAELASSALRHRSRPELEHILASINGLIRADGRTTVFEYCLSTVLHRELFESMYHRAPWGERAQSLGGAAQAVATLLAVLARIGDPDPRRAEAAYRSGMARVLPQQPIPFAPPPQGLVALDAVWPVVSGLRGADQAALVAAMVEVIGHDGTMTVQETELLRTVCATMQVPVPPLTSGAHSGSASAPTPQA